MPVREFFDESGYGLASAVEPVPVRGERRGDQNLALGAQNGLDGSINGLRSTKDCRFERKFDSNQRATVPNVYTLLQPPNRGIVEIGVLVL